MLFTAIVQRGQLDRTQKAVCATVSYAERQAGTVRRGVPGRPGNPAAAKGLRQLAVDMRNTGIPCPPP